MEAPPPERQYLPDLPQKVQDFLYEGRKIEAIKELRDARGIGLAEAKDLCDEAEARLRRSYPAAMPARSRIGCAGAVLVLLLGAGGFALLS